MKGEFDFMKLLFVFTGGTIGSSITGEYISTDKNKPYKLIETYKSKFGFIDSYDITEPYSELSENNTGNTIKCLVSCVKKHINQVYDGIIVTHGTDTLQYSSAALAYSLGNIDIPVCFVSSNYPIEDSRANGIVNLHTAIQFIKEIKHGGVWVAYKNNNELPKIHRATRLASGSAFSDNIDSILNSYYGYYDDKFVFHKNSNYAEKTDEIPELSVNNLSENCNGILRIVPFPGMVYPNLNNEIKYVLHESYHSGTINSKVCNIKPFLQETRNKNISVFLTGVSDEKAYESTKILNDYNVIQLTNCAPISMYMKLWMVVSSGLDPKSIMKKSLAGDIVI